MGNRKKIPLSESYNYLKKLYDNLNNQQSSSEHAPRLFPNINKPTGADNPDITHESQAFENHDK